MKERELPGRGDSGSAARLAHEIRRRRIIAGLSQPQLAQMVGYTRQYVSLAERASRNLPSQELVRGLDSALGADGALVSLRAQAKDEQRDKRVRVRSGGAGEAVGDAGPHPDPLDGFSRASAEARSTLPGISDVVARVTSSETSNELIEQYDRATVSLAESHTQVPAPDILREVLALHGRIQMLLRGQLRLSQQRELYRIESDLLAHACLLLGDLPRNDVAEAYGLASLAYSREAGVCQAFGRSALSKTYRWQKRWVESADIARQGFMQCPDLPVRAQLASQEANAAALLGDSRRAGEALARAQAPLTSPRKTQRCQCGRSRLPARRSSHNQLPPTPATPPQPSEQRRPQTSTGGQGSLKSWRHGRRFVSGREAPTLRKVPSKTLSPRSRPRSP
jgi:transcriptional regulator with XRE-family HTH domain